MRYLLGGVCFLMMSVLIGCTPVTPGGDSMGESETIKIGVIAPLSGPASTYGEDFLHGYTHTVDTINNAGGIDGKQIELIVEDGKCTGKDAVAAVQKLIQVDNVVVIAGGVCSSETIAAGEVAQQAGVVMVSAGSSSPEISGIGDHIFRYWNDAEAAKTMTDFFQEQGADELVLVYENSDYAVAYIDQVKAQFDAEILAEEQFAAEEKDFGLLAKRITEAAEQADYVVFLPQTESAVVSFVKALIDEGVRDDLRDKFVGAETVVSETTINELGDDANGIKGARFPEPDMFDADLSGPIQQLTNGYTAKTSDTFLVLAADSIQLLADAIQANGYSAEGIRTYIAGLTESAPRDSLIGEFWFDEEGDGQGIPFTMVEIRDQEIREIE